MFYTVPAAYPLADKMAQWLLAKYAGQADGLSRVILFLPSRRAIRTVKEAFLRASNGQSLLLPQLIPFGEIDESFVLRHANLSDESIEKFESMHPTPPPMARLMAMQELVWRYGQKMIPQLHNREAALDLASKLLDFIDEMDREHGDWTKLDRLAPDSFAEYWQQTLEFLKIIREHWPPIEEAQGWMRPWQKQNKLIELLVEGWRNTPPVNPVIAAGTTGSTPAVAAILKAIHHFDKGVIILPGFDTKIGEDLLPATHPQAGMQELLIEMELSPEQVGLLPNCEADESARSELLHHAMLPVAQSQEIFNGDSQTALENVHYVQSSSQFQTSLSAALLMREALEESDKVTALVTQDRQLARAVSAHLARWGIEADDSAGQPLALMPQSIFLFLIIDYLQEGFNATRLLSILKHPFCHLGINKAELHSHIRAVEKYALRGISNPTWQKMKDKAHKNCEKQIAFIDKLQQQFEPIQTGFNTIEGKRLAEMVEELIHFAEQLATDEKGDCHLWMGDGSKELNSFFAELIETAPNQQVSVEELAGILRALMRSKTVRAHYGTHPRLQILSSMEARLQRYSRVILADMNEGNWPQAPESDPWINRTMRTELGLPSPDKKIGLQAHDFIQQLASGEVFMLRTALVDGAETIPSRFIQRLAALLPESKLPVSIHPVLHWVEEIQHPQEVLAAMRPSPKPPVAVRPRKLSFTQVEKLMVDPYSIYAQKILELYKLDDIEPQASHAEWGTVVHKILEKYFGSQRDIMDCAEEVFAAADYGYVVDSLWRPRFERIAEWVEQQPRDAKMYCELKGEWIIDAPAGDFILTAKVDRIDDMPEGFKVIDFKTGAIPTDMEMQQGIKSQLVVAAAIIRAGGFKKYLTSHTVAGLEYWKLGGKEMGKITKHATLEGQNLEQAVEQVESRLPEIIAAYDNENKAYDAVPEFRFKPKYNDYEQLERLSEWID